MSEWEKFPVIDWHRAVGEAAGTIAVNKARGAVVRNGNDFALVGWGDIAETLLQSKHTRLGEITAIGIATPRLLGDIAHVHIDALPSLLARGTLREATLYICDCGYQQEMPNTECPVRPCRQEKVG